MTQEDSNGRLISPQELFVASQDEMLDGHQPASSDDWSLLVNFWAWNAVEGLEVSVSLLLAKIFNCPLDEDDVEEIASFQASKKRPN